MDFNLSDEQQMLRDSAERYIRESYPFDLRSRIADSDTACSDEQWAAFAELGWLAVGITEEKGGLGFSSVEVALIAEELGRGLVLEPFLNTAVLSAQLLQSSQAPAADAALAELVEGTLRCAFAHAEQDGRYNWRECELQAVSEEDGFRLDGVKTLVEDAPSAHSLLVLARRSDDQGLALFLVPVATAGLQLTSYPLFDGTRAADVVLTGVKVPQSALVLAGAELESALERAFDQVVLAQCAMMQGAMENVLAITGDYVSTRSQFGQPIGKFQAVQHHLADMYVEVQEGRSALYRALAYSDAEPETRARAVSAAKVTIARGGKLVGATGLQLHGGYGMTEEYPVGQYFRFLAASEKRYGDLSFHADRMLVNDDSSTQ